MRTRREPEILLRLLRLFSQIGRCAMSGDVSLFHVSSPKSSADGVGEGKNNRGKWHKLKKDCDDAEAKGV